MTDRKKLAFMVVSNTDLTEGKGSRFPTQICELKATARRVAKHGYVQGSDCPIQEVELTWKDGYWWGPVRVNPGTKADQYEEPIITAQETAIAKARGLGLTDEEILAIMAK